MSDSNAGSISQCPVMGGAHGRAPSGSTANEHWWPEQVNVGVLHQNTPTGNPMGDAFNYADAFKSLDLDALRADLVALMTDSQSWWPADYGHYGHCLYVWPGIAQALTALVMVAVEQALEANVSRQSIAGRTMATWTKRVACCGLSNKNTAAKFPGPT